MLMTAHTKSVSAFATALRDQAVKHEALNVEFARTAVVELRHNLDAMEAVQQKHMQAMSAEMQAKMKTMMEKMDKERSVVKDQVGALEADVQADVIDAKAMLSVVGNIPALDAVNEKLKRVCSALES